MKAARHQSARLRRLHHESKFSKTIRRDRAGALHTRHGLQPSLHPCVHCWLPRGAAAAPPSTLSARAPAQVLKTRRTYHPFPVFRELRKMSHRDVSGIPRCPRPAKLEMRRGRATPGPSAARRAPARHHRRAFALRCEHACLHNEHLQHARGHCSPMLLRNSTV